MTREEARASIKKHLDLMYPYNTPKDVLKVAYEALGQPEIIRCQDCKHLFDGEHTENCCDVLMKKTGWLKEISVSPDWFCADGKKRS